jgi:sulfide:quinone oxidoreductase
MNKKMIKHTQEVIEEVMKKEGISRRDALKLIGLGSAATMMGSVTSASAATEARAASSAKGKIVIVGGGLAGMSTAARLAKNLENPDITVIEPNDRSTTYQPGLTLIGGYTWTDQNIIYKTEDYVPSGVKLIRDRVVEFDPKANKVTTAGGQTISYDFMVIASGLVLDFGRIKGLEEVGELYTAGYNQKAADVFGKSGAGSIYFIEGAMKVKENLHNFIEAAKSGKKVQGVYTHPNTPIKCGGAPKKIMFLTDSNLRHVGARKNAELTFYPNGSKMFGVPEYNEAIFKLFEEKGMKYKFAHNLTEVDLANKVAVFDHHWKEKGEYDPDLEEYEMITKHERVEVPFDFLHITPPMKAPDEIGKSPVGSSKGWVPVDYRNGTLQHIKFKNIFALGDVAALPLGKTGGSARKQYKVVVDNLIALMEGREPTAKYGGYTVCPLITEIGKVMLAEFDWSDPANGKFNGKMIATLPLRPDEPHWAYWLLKVYLLKPMTQYGMLRGLA